MFQDIGERKVQFIKYDINKYRAIEHVKNPNGTTTEIPHEFSNATDMITFSERMVKTEFARQREIVEISLKKLNAPKRPVMPSLEVPTSFGTSREASLFIRNNPEIFKQGQKFQIG